jgi:transketolase
VNVPVIKPLDVSTIVSVAKKVLAVVTVENHTIIGGLGSAVAEAVAEAGVPVTLRRIGLRDTFAEGARSASHLFRKYGLSSQDIVDEAWQALGGAGSPPVVTATPVSDGEYAPV